MIQLLKTLLDLRTKAPDNEIDLAALSLSFSVFLCTSAFSAGNKYEALYYYYYKKSKEILAPRHLLPCAICENQKTVQTACPFNKFVMTNKSARA